VPEQVSPADGATVPAGTRLAFTIRTFAGDNPGYLWLLVSRSPQPEDACGTIANEVSIHQFETTADPAVYQARPTYFSGPSFWMNKPGTYYWQAYRIHHGDGADGCIESPVRRLVVGAAALPTAPVKADVPAVQDLAFDGKRFYIRVQYRIRERRLVRLCELGCRASVEIRSRTGRRIYAKRLPGDTALILGKKAVRAIPSGVRVRIDVPIDRTKLLKTKFRTVGNHRVGETRLRVSLVTRSGTALTVRDGAIRVSIARIRSGALPGLQSILAL
jgi:hypothetical protein